MLLKAVKIFFDKRGNRLHINLRGTENFWKNIAFKSQPIRNTSEKNLTCSLNHMKFIS